MKENPDQITITEEERLFLLNLARDSIEEALNGREHSPIDRSNLSDRLNKLGVCFVTLTINGELRGCVGALEAYQPLVDDVQEHAVAAAFNDFRFPPLTASEFPDISIEISCLTPPEVLEYKHPEDLLNILKPDNGVILKYQGRRATFLPQVWENLPEAEEFLCHLCQKMGVDPYLWRYRKMLVQIYRVEKFHEER